MQSSASLADPVPQAGSVSIQTRVAALAGRQVPSNIARSMNMERLRMVFFVNSVDNLDCPLHIVNQVDEISFT